MKNVKLTRGRLLSSTVLPLAVVAAMGAAAPAFADGHAADEAPAAACGACNPCAADACNPCAADACNPCAADACNPCNPCQAAD